MPSRDDDPLHPNFDGIRFQATTDRQGIVATPLSAQVAPPISYMTVGEAAELSHLIGQLARKVSDQQSYLVDYLQGLQDDLDMAIQACVTP